MRQYVFILVLFLGATRLGVPGTHAQTPSAAPSTLFSLDVRGQSLKTALASFTAETKVGVIYNSAMVAGKKTACSITQAPLDAVLRCILEGIGLVFEKLSTGTYVLKLKPPEPSTSSSTARHSRFTISGYIRDAKTGEALIGAALYDTQRQTGTTSNAYGFYSLTLPQGPVNLVASYLGYEKAHYERVLTKDLTLNIDLRPAALGLDTLVVEASQVDALEQRTEMSVVTLPVQQVQEMPTLLGEPDVLRAVQLLPGVQSGNEGTTGLYVRGGSVDQNLVLLDGATVYNPSHLFGFLSIFNTRALNDITLVKGGFPARYGGRLSSVLDLSMKEGNMKRLTGEASLGLGASSVTLEGPLQKERTSFIVSGRRSLVDVATRPFTNEDDFPAYALFDLNAKVNHRFSAGDRVYLSFYGGNDRYLQRNIIRTDTANQAEGDIQTEFGIRWGNLLSTLRWNHLFSNKLFSNLTLFHSRYKLRTREEDLRYTRTEAGIQPELFRLRYDSGVSDWGFKADFDFVPSPSHAIRFGAHATHHTFSTGTIQTQEAVGEAASQEALLAPVTDITTQEVDLYLEDDIKLGRRFSANLGLHASGYRVEGTTYTSLQPRLSTRFLVSPRWAFKASYAHMAQYLHLLVNSGLGLPTDLWLPVTERVKPQRSHQVAAGLAHTIKGRLEVSLEAYYKTMDGLIEYAEGANFLGAGQDWQDNIEVGAGESYGVELFVQKQTGRTTGWLGYTLSWTERQFDALNEGRPFPFRYDRRHDVALTLTHRLAEWLTVSGSWVYGTGNAITLGQARFSPAVFPDASGPRLIYAPNDEVVHLGTRNGFRMPAYHRLDLGFNFAWRSGWGTHALTLGAYNTYNRKNPYFIFSEDEPVLDGGLITNKATVVKQASLFPVLPSMSYSIRF